MIKKTSFLTSKVSLNNFVIIREIYTEIVHKKFNPAINNCII